MAKEPRDAVVSVRISEEDQARLRQLATERGTSVSELVRSVVIREVTEAVAPPRAAGVTSGPAPRIGTTTAAQQGHTMDNGLFWEVDSPSAVSGATVTLRS